MYLPVNKGKNQMYINDHVTWGLFKAAAPGSRMSTLTIQKDWLRRENKLFVCNCPE